MRFILISCCLIISYITSAQIATEAVSLTTPTGILKGTLVLPSADIKKCNMVVIQAGSGNIDRNGNSGRIVTANSYRLLADSLAANNIATLLIDKRGVGESKKALTKEDDLRFQNYATDVADWVNFLKEDKRSSKIYIAGHSEGALVGMLAALQTNIDGFISIAGAGETIDKIISEQYGKQIAGADKFVDSLFNRLKNNDTIANLPSIYMGIFRKSVQPYILSWVAIDPCETIKKIKVPILIIQGTTDVQVTTQQAAILKKCNPKATLLIIDGMNHILKQSPMEIVANTATYSNADLPLMPGLTTAIVQFINKY